MTTPAEQFITFLYTSDLEKTARFYAQDLGLPLVRDQGDCRIYRVSPSGYLGICQREAGAPSGVILTLVSDQVDEWHRRLEERGVASERPPAHNPRYGIYHFFVRDPDGRLIEIQRFDQPLA